MAEAYYPRKKMDRSWSDRILPANSILEAGNITNPIARAAIIGVLLNESGLDGTSRRLGGSDTGIAQWTTPRHKTFWNVYGKLFDDAARYGGDIRKVPMERQLQVVLNERPDVMRAINNASDLRTATDIMLRAFENGGGTFRTMASPEAMNRVYGRYGTSHAKQLASRLGYAYAALDAINAASGSKTQPQANPAPAPSPMQNPNPAVAAVQNLNGLAEPEQPAPALVSQEQVPVAAGYSPGFQWDQRFFNVPEAPKAQGLRSFGNLVQMNPDSALQSAFTDIFSY